MRFLVLEHLINLYHMFIRSNHTHLKLMKQNYASNQVSIVNIKR